jgi:amino acid transporter
MAAEKPTPAPYGNRDPEAVPVPETETKTGTLQALIEADLLDSRYQNTQRGLKTRHVQLMALGGTIGSCAFTLPPSSYPVPLE